VRLLGVRKGWQGGREGEEGVMVAVEAKWGGWHWPDTSAIFA